MSKFSFLVLFLTSIISATSFSDVNVPPASLSSLKDCSVFENCFGESRPNAPFKMIHQPKSQKAILLFHGLSDSPYFMKDIAARFFQLGYDVIAPLVPGHGTTPEDLLHIEKEDWVKSSEQWYELARKNWASLRVGGFSNGGMISIRLTAKHTNDFEKLYLFAPAIEIKNSKAYQTCPLHQVIQAVRFIPFETLKNAASKAVGAVNPSGEWINPEAKTTPIKYGPKTLASVCALYKLTFASSYYLRQIRTPIEAVLSGDDETVDSIVALKKLAQSQSSSVDILVLASNKSVKTFLETKRQLQADRRRGLSIHIAEGSAVAHGGLPLQFNEFMKGFQNPQFQTLESFIFGNSAGA
ncbi:MAG: alpha/beta hydrolase, partial [Bdellovibrionales bacterium]|nr:alpha/beta hydrolase [Bdellovibrionales bacterium]